jgi:hypothetical protein
MARAGLQNAVSKQKFLAAAKKQKRNRHLP